MVFFDFEVLCFNGRNGKWWMF